MHRASAVIASAFTAVMALGLAGCADAGPPAAPQTPRPITGTSARALPTQAPLPPVDQLTGVLYRLADTSVPAEQKVGLVQYATADEQPALDNFGRALAASGFAPLTVNGTDPQWAGEPGHVVATITIGSTNPAVKPFTFPMDFAPVRDTWQLSKRTADQLLPLLGTAPPQG